MELLNWSSLSRMATSAYRFQRAILQSDGLRYRARNGFAETVYAGATGGRKKLRDWLPRYHGATRRSAWVSATVLACPIPLRYSGSLEKCRSWRQIAGGNGARRVRAPGRCRLRFQRSDARFRRRGRARVEVHTPPRGFLREWYGGTGHCYDSDVGNRCYVAKIASLS